jgi:ABC-type multidrug transport system fused ATPase/permease subunit
LYIARQDTLREIKDGEDEIVKDQVEEFNEIDPAEPKITFTLPRLIALIGPEWCLVVLGRVDEWV